MSGQPATPGAIVWQDLTVPDADRVRDFYAEVLGWTFTGEGMGDYEDYNMRDAGGNVVAGVCHARGPNTDIPPQWILYVAVPDVAAAAERAVAFGGEVVTGPRRMGGGGFAVVKDPAGAVIGLFCAGQEL